MAKKFSIKGLFFEEAGDAADQPKDAAQPQKSETASAPAAAAQTPRRRPEGSAVAAAAVAVSSPSAAAPFAESGVPDPQTLDLLQGALESSNQEGYDYLEFRKAVEQQKSIIADEKVRFQAALAAASVMGVTAPKLVDSAQYYLTVLKSKERDFQEAQDAHMRREVTARTDESATIDKEIAKASEQVAELTRKIAEMQQKKAQLEKEASEQSVRIQGVKTTFDRTLRVVVDGISSDVAKIKNYLMA